MIIIPMTDAKLRKILGFSGDILAGAWETLIKRAWTLRSTGLKILPGPGFDNLPGPSLLLKKRWIMNFHSVE
uniref:Uncharacterized protein n=1 Tax=Romanomermis culicivorax TaxID=13658 RepID=A0A915IV26_ROMCU